MNLLERWGIVKAIPPAVDLGRSPARIRSPQGRPSWDLFGVGLAGTPLSEIRQTQNLNLYPLFRQTLPVIDRGIDLHNQFTGTPIVEADDATKTEIEDWMRRLRVNRCQQGFVNGWRTFKDDLFTYGRSHAEILLTADGRDVWGIQQLPVPTIFYRQSADRGTVEVLQRQAGQWRLLNPLLMMNASLDIRSDDPYGKSSLFSVPFVAEIATSMLKSMGGLYSRFGNPSFHIHVETPANLSDPDGSVMGTFMQNLQAAWDDAMRSRAEGDVKDFFSSGGAGTSVSVMGGEGEALDFKEPMQILEEQIIAKSGFPSFMYAKSWSTTERMSAVQAALIREMINYERACMQSEVEYLINFRQRVTGGDQEVRLCWDDVTLIDQTETATAEKTQAEADKARYEHMTKLWRDKMVDGYDVARACLPSYDGMSNEEIDAKRSKAGLPPIPAEAPAPELPPAFGGGPGGQQQGRQNGSQPILTPTRSLTYADSSNGNGRH